MVFQVMKLDRSWKAVPLMTLAYALLSPLLLRLTGFTSPEFSEIPLIFMFGAVMLCGANIRATLFHISLPISGRQLFLARILSILAVLWAPSAAACVVLALQGSGGPEIARQLIEVTSVLTLMVLIMQSIRVQESQVPAKRVTFAILLAAAILWPVFGWNLPVLPVLMILLPASAVVFFYIWKNIPESFQIASAKGSAKSASAAHTISSQGTIPHRFQLLKWRPLLRSIFPWLYLIWLPLFYLVGHSGSLFAYSFLTIILWISTRQRIRWLSMLPFSRSTVLAAFIIPILLMMVGGHLIGAYRSPFRKSPYGIYVIPNQTWPLTHSNERNCGMLNVIPPIEFWKPAHDDKAPVIQAPWGESFQPPLSFVYGVRIYNPYAVGPKNSQRFFNWQSDRATRAVYGRALPRSEYQWPGAPPPIVVQARIQVLQIAGITGWVLIGVFFIELLGWRCIGRLGLPARVVCSILIFVPLLVPILRPELLIAFLDSLPLRISWALRDNLLLVIMAVAVPLAGLYWITDKLFRESEIIDRPRQVESF